MHRFVRFTVTAAVLLLAVVAVAAQNSGTQVVGGNETALREMVSRAFATYPAYADSEATVYVGSLPKDLPFELKLPDSIRVIGSITRGNTMPTEILLDATQSPAQVTQFFDDIFSADDWTIMDTFVGGGFTDESTDSGLYCNPANDLMVSVNAFGYGSDMSDVRVYITPDDSSKCGGSSDDPPVQVPHNLLPQLTTPEGVRLLQGDNMDGGGGAGFQSVSTHAYLETELSMPEVAAAYNEQLTAAGWIPVGEETSDKLSWSGWSVQGDNQMWAGTLTITANPTVENQYMATLSILETPDKQ